MKFFTKKNLRNLKIFYKEEYDNFLQQDHFWLNQCLGDYGRRFIWNIMVIISKTDEIILVPGKIVPMKMLKKYKCKSEVLQRNSCNDGDFVRKGDLLFHLDIESSLAESRTLNDSLDLKITQLKLKSREFDEYMSSRKVDIELLSNMVELDKNILEKYNYLLKEGASSEILYLNQKIKVINH